MPYREHQRIVSARLNVSLGAHMSTQSDRERLNVKAQTDVKTDDSETSYRRLIEWFTAISNHCFKAFRYSEAHFEGSSTKLRKKIQGKSFVLRAPKY